MQSSIYKTACAKQQAHSHSVLLGLAIAHPALLVDVNKADQSVHVRMQQYPRNTAYMVHSMPTQASTPYHEQTNCASLSTATYATPTPQDLLPTELLQLTCSASYPLIGIDKGCFSNNLRMNPVPDVFCTQFLLQLHHKATNHTREPAQCAPTCA
jgi:hypothetical protein